MQKRLKLFSGIVLHAYNISGSELKISGKSGNNKKRDWLSSVPFYIIYKRFVYIDLSVLARAKFVS